MNLVPAYGRDYKSVAEVKKAWQEGKDFLIQDISAGMDNGRYCSIRDFAGKEVWIRYAKPTKVVRVQ